MTCFRFTEVWLFFLLLRLVCSVEPEPMFRAKGSNVEMGYCFGVDYIVVYRSTRDGHRLLGNSSNKDLPSVPPTDLQGRVSVTEDQNLLGLQIRNLSHMDSGSYFRECWQNQTLVSKHTQQLSVCNEEIEYEDVFSKTEDGRTVLLCNSTSVGLEGTSVRWYFAMHPNYTLRLVLDSSVSLEPLAEELSSVVEVRDRGTLLLVNDNTFSNNQYFTCLVMKGTDCLSFQNMYPPDHNEYREIFASQGDRVVLNCPADGTNQEWDTPLGKISDNSMKNKQVYISSESGDFSLVISAVSDEHSGDYSCVSSSAEILYSLVLCFKRETEERVVHEGEDISLECSLNLDDSQRVQWHRQELSGQSEVIHDTKDATLAIPEDLRGRLTLSENGNTMTISNLKRTDRGEYWCVVLQYLDFLESAEDYDVDYDREEDAEEARYSGGDYWPATIMCLLKQVTILNTTNVQPTTFSSVIPTTAATSDASNVPAIAVGGGLVGLLLVGAIIAGIVVKKKKAKASERQTASHSGLYTKPDMQLHGDPGCTDSLTNNDDVA